MIGNANEIITWLLKVDREKKYEVKEHREKRSLNANDYYWVIVNQIANILRISKEDLHIRFLKEYGQIASALIPDDVDIRGYTKYYELSRKINVKGKVFNEYRLFKGSSEMDKKEMAILLDGVIAEAKELGIETLTPNEIAQMKGLE
jgi:hypothetical protein